MSKQVIIAEQHRIAAVFSEDQIEEIIVAAGTHQVGDVYMGVVENILTSIDAAFVNIGDGERNGFIHMSDLGPLKLRRNANSISDLLSPQQKVLVQVMKEPTGNKGPRLTGNISMPGRYAVLLPYGRGVNLSKRIKNESERNRLRALGILVKPAGTGLLLRTEADGVSEDAIIEDLENLQKQWEGIQQDAGITKSPTLLSRDRDFVQKVLRDAYSTDVNRIVVDSPEGLKRIKHHLLNWGEGKISPALFIDYHRERSSILEYFRVNAAIREALKPRVDLPSGGYIIIQPTEALTVIDVNSGSFTRSQTSRETVLWTNIEAAKEIARQIRLRNIAGMIVVDFIDMDTRRDQLQLLEEFNKVLRADKSRPQIAQLTELGLVEMTRKRMGQSIYELFGQQCPTCSGLGIIARLPGETVTPVEHYHHDLATQFVAEFSKDESLLAEDEEDSRLSGGLELNLVNHPNYQERGGGNSRRSKRRSRDGEREVRLRRETKVVLPKLVLPTVVSTNGVPAIEPQIPEPSEPIVELKKRELPRPKPEPAQPVVIEMTEQEQEVYAHLGISPLVYVERQHEPNLIPIVTLPGVKPQLPLLEVAAVDGEAAESKLPDLPTPKRAIEPLAVAPAPDAEIPSPKPILEQVVETPVAVVAEPKPKEELKIESPVASRRRRSGA
ncbi:MAG: Rne/Rng family ribonuclease [Pseudanabaenaceae cyanobacterium bins.68]|nr:Rne/Rng family ribonuclease [Pseudanabaenaceae cyanobacterium bins.68]